MALVLEQFMGCESLIAFQRCFDYLYLRSIFVVAPTYRMAIDCESGLSPRVHAPNVLLQFDL